MSKDSKRLWPYMDGFGTLKEPAKRRKAVLKPRDAVEEEEKLRIEEEVEDDHLPMHLQAIVGLWA